MADIFNVNAPRALSYGPPNMAAELYGMFGNLPEDYFKGTQMARTRELQKPYEIPTDESGRPDYAKLLRDVGKFQGIEGAAKVFPEMIGMQSSADIQRAIAGGGQPTSTTPRTGAPYETSGPDPNQMSKAAGRPTRQEREGAAGGGYSIRDLVERSPFNFEDRNSVIGGIARKLRINPTKPLDEDQLGQVSAEIENQYGGRSHERARYTSMGDVNVAPGGGDDYGSTSTAAGSASTQTGIPAQASAGAPPDEPLMPRQVQTVAAPPIPGLRTAQAAEAAPGVASPIGTLADADRLDARAAQLNAIGASYKASPAAAAAAKDAAERAAAQAKQIRESITKYGETLDPRMQAARIGQAGAEARGKEEAERYGKELGGIQNMGTQSAIGRQKVALAKSLMKSPDFYSGPLQPTHQLYKQFQSYFGERPASALPEEAMNKVINDMLTEQIKAMGQSGVGRVLLAEVQNMRNSIASMKITPASNRLLMEIVDKTYEKNEAIAKMASEYKGGRLDPDFYFKVSKYISDHPMFTKDELRDPRLIAPPEFNSFAEAKKAGLAKGEPIKIKGELYHVDTR